MLRSHVTLQSAGGTMSTESAGMECAARSQQAGIWAEQCQKFLIFQEKPKVLM